VRSGKKQEQATRAAEALHPIMGMNHGRWAGSSGMDTGAGDGLAGPARVTGMQPGSTPLPLPLQEAPHPDGAQTKKGGPEAAFF